MIYLFLAIVASALITVTMRVGSRYSRNRFSLLAVNYVTCALLAWAFTGSFNVFPAGEGALRVGFLGLGSGVLYLVSFLLLQWNISKNGVVLPATFMKLGVLVPTILAVTVYGETLTVWRVCGFVLAIFAILLIQGKSEGKRESTVGLVVLLLMGGITDAMSKIFEEYCPSAFSDYYLFYTFFAALILCAALCVFKKQKLTLRDVLIGICIGIPNYFSSRFLLMALMHGVDAVVVYPTFSVGTIIVVAVFGAFVFREKFDKRRLIALSVILVSLVLLNIEEKPREENDLPPVSDRAIVSTASEAEAGE